MAGAPLHGKPNSENRAAKSAADVLVKLLDRLDAQETEELAGKRAAPRCGYRKTEVPIRIHHPGGSSIVKTVATRNLSAFGLGFLYGGFLYSGTRMEVILKRQLGGEDILRGKITTCTHVAGVLHQVGCKFDDKIFPKLYLDPGSYEELDIETPEDTSKLIGRILYLDDQEVDRMLLRHHLKKTPLELVTVDTPEAAIEKLKTEKFDLVFCDLNLESMPGEQAVKMLRGAGFRGALCLVTAETNPQRLKAATEAGAMGVLSKPYERDKLIAMLSSFLGSSENEIHSGMAGNAEMTPMIERYVASIKATSQELQQAVEADNIDKLRTCAMTIKGTGAGYGFNELSDAAKEAVKSLDATCSIGESVAQVQKLIDMCRRVAIGVK